MKNETKDWQNYTIENLDSLKIFFESCLCNPCLQNVQQSVEKALKLIFIEKSIKIKRTYDMLELKYLSRNNGLDVDISDDECDFLNTIDLPSKYPLGNVLPDFEPDEEICKYAIEIAEKAFNSVKQILTGVSDSEKWIK
ncbi:MAG: HEPN domain-containing protein [Deltaproteobacteria bacterium]|nr:HEPN domain-containing protein [Deltaproteobacteria bacterium]